MSNYKKIIYWVCFIIFTIMFFNKLNNKLYELRIYMAKADEFISKPATQINKEVVDYLDKKYKDKNLYISAFDLDNSDNKIGDYTMLIKSYNSNDTIFEVKKHKGAFSDDYEQRVKSGLNTYYRYYKELTNKKSSLQNLINDKFELLYYSNLKNDYINLSEDNLEICKSIYGTLLIDSKSNINDYNKKAVLIHINDDEDYTIDYMANHIKHVVNLIQKQNIIIQQYDFSFEKRLGTTITISTLTKEQIQTIDLYKFIEQNATVRENLSK